MIGRPTTAEWFIRAGDVVRRERGIDRWRVLGVDHGRRETWIERDGRVRIARTAELVRISEKEIALGPIEPWETFETRTPGSTLARRSGP